MTSELALPAPFRLIAYQTIGSTNDEAKRLARDGAAEHDWRRRRQMPPQQCHRGAELPGPRPRHRVVEGDDKTGARGCSEPALDQLPGLEIV